MRTLLLACLASALVPLTACNFYFGGGDDDPPCADWGGGGSDGAAEPAILLRNPQSGECQAFGSPWQPPYPCDGECGPCYDTGSGSGTSGSGTTSGTPTDPEMTPSGAESDSAQQAPMPSWGSCESYCTGLDETSCLGSEGCRGIYATGIDSTEFIECWQTGTNPIAIADCSGQDAETCSQSDSCIAIHEYACVDGDGQAPDGSGLMEPTCNPGAFVSCGNEPLDVEGCYSDNECEVGSHCNAAEVCNPPPGSGDCGDRACDLPLVCYGVCVPDVAPVACPALESEASCIAREDCSPYYIGENCVCDGDPDSCVCSTWTYDSCDTAPAP